MSAERVGRLQRRLPFPADRIWGLLRDFTGIHHWHPLVQDCRPATADASIRPGLTRRMRMLDDTEITEVLTELSDDARTLSYCMLAPFPFPIDSSLVTVAVTDGPTPNAATVTMTGHVHAADTDAAEQFVSASEHTVWPAAIDGLHHHASRQ